VRGTFAKPDYHLETGNLVARLGAAIGLGVAFPPAALLPLIDTGLGDNNACSRAYAAQQPPGNPAPKSGSSAPPQQR
jgi:AsmA family protein